MTSRSTTNLLFISFCILLCLPLAHSFWRLPCARPITVQRLDPIINNGSTAAHIHTVMGGSAFNARAGPDSIKQSKCSTCTVKEDNSNYWIGTLFYQHPNGTMESVKQTGGMLVYYLQRYADANEKLHAFPPGFRMIAGDPMKRTSDTSLESRAITYNCLDYRNGTPETGAFPHKNCPQGLRTQVFFPSCWDGVNLDSPDHKSHMAYPDGMDNGKCPSTHPVRMVSIFYEIVWETGKFASAWIDEHGKPFRAQPFIWSFGDNTGYGLHGDFINGWNVNVLQRAVDDCTDLSGVVEKCQHFTFRSDEQANACLPEYLPDIKEQVFGQMPNMPNIAVIPVAEFDPCGISPTQGFDNTIAGQPLGTCKGDFTNKLAYIPANGAMGHNTPALPLSTLAPNPIDQTGYLGCFADTVNGVRTMEQLIGTGYTPATCRLAASSYGDRFVVFSVQFGGECWASSSATTYNSQGSSSHCTMYCNADPDQMSFCGGAGANQAYSVNPNGLSGSNPGVANPIDQTGYLGCWVDSVNGQRTMETQLSGSKYTPETCRQAVQALGSKYVLFAIQYGGECWASSSLVSYKLFGTSSQCNMACNADSTKATICGGPRANQVYSINV